MFRRRQGFTLVEMLVVIAIIIILAAVLFPVFVRAREKAQQTKCINNLKQWAAAVELYEDDYEGGICPVSIGAGQPGQETAASAAIYTGSMWGDLINPYLKQLKRGYAAGAMKGQGELTFCPSTPFGEMTQGKAWQSSGKTYGYNAYLTRYTTASNVKYPSLTYRITETANYQYNPHNPLYAGTMDDYGFVGGSWYGPLPDGQQRGYNFELTSPGWHNGMSEVLWVDGHVSTLTWQQVMLTDNLNGTTDINVWARLEPKVGTHPD